MRTRLPLGLAAVLAVVICVAVAVPAGAAVPIRQVTGVLQSVDVAGATITLIKQNRVVLKLDVPADTRIQRNGAALGLGGLVLGDRVTVRYNAQTRRTIRVSGAGPAVTRFSGTLTDARKGTGVLVVNTPQGAREVQTDARTRMARRGVRVPFGAAVRGDTVHVAMRMMRVRGAKKLQPVVFSMLEDGRDAKKVRGTIAIIDGTDVTITPSNGTPDVTVHVAEGTMIEIDGEPATLADLLVGQWAEAYYDAETFEAFSIEAESEGGGDQDEVKGTVTAVNAAANTVSIARSGSCVIVILTVTASTNIEVDGHAAALSDIKVGMPIRAEYDPATLVASEIKAGKHDCNEHGHVSGGVTEVTETTITVDPAADCLPVTLVVDGATRIRINGVDARLGDILVGDHADAEYEKETLLALELNIKR